MTTSAGAKRRKRKVSDGAAVTNTRAKRGGGEGGSEASFSIPDGYLAIYYKHADGTVEPHTQGVFQIASKDLVNCTILGDVVCVLREQIYGLDHVGKYALRFCKGAHHIIEYEDFLDHLRRSDKDSPVQGFCPPPVHPVAETTPRKSNVEVRYREYAPSSFTPRNVRKVQVPRYSEEDALFKCGRPADATGLEAPLMHPVFGTFLDNLRDASLPTTDDYAFAREFCQKSSDFYGTELERQIALLALLDPYLRRTVSPMKAKKNAVDGYIGRRTGFPVYCIVEVENELGSTSTDNFFQGQSYYENFCDGARSSVTDSSIFASCNCPAFLVELRGPHMRISALAYLDRVHADMLTDLVNLSSSSESLANIFRALKLGIDSLESFYEQLTVGTSPRLEWLIMAAPYPIWYKPNMTIKSKLDESQKLLYLAEDDKKRELIIKFCRRYGVKVHQAWYSAGFAPELLDVKERPGGFKTIAMEYLGPPWQTLVSLGQPETKRRARLAVREALEKVHRLRVFDLPNAGSVHGDVRDLNIMVRPHGEGFDVKFVDFDWAGQESVWTYPPNMNHEMIAWPEGVAAGKPMLQRHDTELLDSNHTKVSNYNWRRGL